MEFDLISNAIIPWVTALAVIYMPMIAYIAFELWRAPLVDDNGNVISESTTDRFAIKQTRLKPFG
jgi:hypothetical protein